jgi:hypothetical protein
LLGSAVDSSGTRSGRAAPGWRLLLFFPIAIQASTFGTSPKMKKLPDAKWIALACVVSLWAIARLPAIIDFQYGPGIETVLNFAAELILALSVLFLIIEIYCPLLSRYRRGRIR